MNKYLLIHIANTVCTILYLCLYFLARTHRTYWEPRGILVGDGWATVITCTVMLTIALSILVVFLSLFLTCKGNTDQRIASFLPLLLSLLYIGLWINFYFTMV